MENQQNYYMDPNVQYYQQPKPKKQNSKSPKQHLNKTTNSSNTSFQNQNISYQNMSRQEKNLNLNNLLDVLHPKIPRSSSHKDIRKPKSPNNKKKQDNLQMYLQQMIQQNNYMAQDQQYQDISQFMKKGGRDISPIPNQRNFQKNQQIACPIQRNRSPKSQQQSGKYQFKNNVQDLMQQVNRQVNPQMHQQRQVINVTQHNNYKQPQQQYPQYSNYALQFQPHDNNNIEYQQEFQMGYQDSQESDCSSSNFKYGNISKDPSKLVNTDVLEAMKRKYSLTNVLGQTVPVRSKSPKSQMNQGLNNANERLTQKLKQTSEDLLQAIKKNVSPKGSKKIKIKTNQNFTQPSSSDIDNITEDQQKSKMKHTLKTNINHNKRFADDETQSDASAYSTNTNNDSCSKEQIIQDINSQKLLQLENSLYIMSEQKSSDFKVLQACMNYVQNILNGKGIDNIEKIVNGKASRQAIQNMFLQERIIVFLCLNEYSLGDLENSSNMLNIRNCLNYVHQSFMLFLDYLIEQLEKYQQTDKRGLIQQRITIRRKQKKMNSISNASEKIQIISNYNEIILPILKLTVSQKSQEPFQSVKGILEGESLKYQSVLQKLQVIFDVDNLLIISQEQLDTLEGQSESQEAVQKQQQQIQKEEIVNKQKEQEDLQKQLQQQMEQQLQQQKQRFQEEQEKMRQEHMKIIEQQRIEMQKQLQQQTLQQQQQLQALEQSKQQQPSQQQQQTPAQPELHLIQEEHEQNEQDDPDKNSGDNSSSEREKLANTAEQEKKEEPQEKKDQEKSAEDEGTVGTAKAPYLKELSEEKMAKTYTLVLDLDETLVHYEELEDGGQFLVRPYAETFLKEMSKYYEIVIFTAALKDYADFILDIIDVDKVIDARLYRQHTVPNDNSYVKDLSKLGRDLDKTIIIDNLGENFSLQQDNGIQIYSWVGETDDRALYELTPLLKQIVEKEFKDVRQALKQFKEQMINNIQNNVANPQNELNLDPNKEA